MDAYQLVTWCALFVSTYNDPFHYPYPFMKIKCIQTYILLYAYLDFRVSSFFRVEAHATWVFQGSGCPLYTPSLWVKAKRYSEHKSHFFCEYCHLSWIEVKWARCDSSLLSLLCFCPSSFLSSKSNHTCLRCLCLCCNLLCVCKCFCYVVCS